MDPSHVAFSHHGILGKRYALLRQACTPQSVPHMTARSHLLVDRCAGKRLDGDLIMQGCARGRPLRDGSNARVQPST